MTRTVAALYDSRAEAEFARTRLVSRVKARSPRIIGRDTVGAIDGIDIAPAAAETYRKGVAAGSHLLVAEVPSGTRPDRVIELLKEAIDHRDRREDYRWGDGERGVQVDIERDEPVPASPDAVPEPMQPRFEPREAASNEGGTSADGDRASDREIEAIAGEGQKSETEVPSGGARVRSITHDAPAEEQVTLSDESIDVEVRRTDRPLNENEVPGDQLFQDRVFEIAEMREEPVVTKISVVREEVIVRKIVKHRSETIRDTVRQTEIEVEDLPSTDGAFFRRQP